MLRSRQAISYAAAAAAALILGSCSAAPQGSGSAPDALPVTAAFYPLAFAAEQIGGDRVAVTTLTKPGVEPHDVELTPKDVAGLGKASVVIYLKGFQNAVDTAAATQQGAHLLDVSGSARLTLAAAQEHAEEEAPDAAHAADAMDPHFWLDPTRYAEVGTAIAEDLAVRDPRHADAYRAGAKDFAARLSALDEEFRAGLATCRSRVLVTGHSAFGYLAQRYHLSPLSVAGLSPESEPSAAQLAALTTTVKERGIRTIYSETLANPALVQTLSRETGARVEVLDPVEGITDSSAGRDYFAVMRANLTTLKAGQDCSG